MEQLERPQDQKFFGIMIQFLGINFGRGTTPIS